MAIKPVPPKNPNPKNPNYTNPTTPSKNVPSNNPNYPGNNNPNDPNGDISDPNADNDNSNDNNRHRNPNDPNYRATTNPNDPNYPNIATRRSARGDPGKPYDASKSTRTAEVGNPPPNLDSTQRMIHENLKGKMLTLINNTDKRYQVNLVTQVPKDPNTFQDHELLPGTAIDIPTDVSTTLTVKDLGI